MTRRHPIDIAAHRIDFTIMANHAEGLRQRPSGKCIGGKTLMHQRHSRHSVGVAQIIIIGPSWLDKSKPL